MTNNKATEDFHPKEYSEGVHAEATTSTSRKASQIAH